mmetsp:Transcript_29384/g.53575  ORF Transcript_29384/g.53575 Transcript_29384/m.53575 type:complete len:555 (-) Transcript_29384:162-1826(-)
MALAAPTRLLYDPIASSQPGLKGGIFARPHPARGSIKQPRIQRHAAAAAAWPLLATRGAQAVVGTAYFAWRVCCVGVGVTSIGVAGLLSLIVGRQYGPIIKNRRRLPKVDIGLPVIGQSHNILKHGWSGGGSSWLRQMQAKNGQAFVFNLLFVNRVAVDYTLYEEHMQALERDGQLRPLFSKSMQQLLGRSSMLTLPGGKGGDLHAKVRQKVAPALAPAELIRLAPQVEAMCRKMLEEMVEETSKEGSTCLLPKTNRLTQDVAAASLLGALADPSLPHLSKLSDLLDLIIAGLFTVPFEKSFGKLTPFGEAMQAKREASALIDELMEEARRTRATAGAGPAHDVLARLAQDSEEGKALTAEEVQDTVLTIGFAGKVTAAAALPVAVVELGKRPEWREKLKKSSTDFAGGIEKAQPALQFIRESMRLKPPAAAFYRASDDWIELGEHGAVPPGMPVAVCMDYPGAGLAGEKDEFKPERWTEDFAKKHFIYFGGATPHSCPGRQLALMEMQIFLHLLCKEYDFEVLSEDTFVDRAFTQVKYKDGLPMKVMRKAVRA